MNYLNLAIAALLEGIQHIPEQYVLFGAAAIEQGQFKIFAAVLQWTSFYAIL